MKQVSHPLVTVDWRVLSCCTAQRDGLNDSVLVEQCNLLVDATVPATVINWADTIVIDKILHTIHDIPAYMQKINQVHRMHYVRQVT
jgi:hypothetical protein